MKLQHKLNESLEELSRLTSQLSGIDELGVPAKIVDSIDLKLNEANRLIREAQQDLSAAKMVESKRLEEDAKKILISDAKDAVIVQLKEELKEAKAGD